MLSRWIGVACFSLATVAVSAQNRTVTGTVVDTQNNPVPGASVVLDGTTRGTAALGDGTFTLPNVPASGTLTVSMMGYTDQAVTLTGSNTYRITLSEDTQFLDEVVVVGYGVQRKSDVTGAVISVGAEQLQERPTSNAFEALQGKAAGVDITNNVRPGELGQVRIRGERSIGSSDSDRNSRNSPLYVIDGIPMSGRNNINSINTYDIQSIEILKDASATAIYGSRGANGVILITTNKGTEGRFSINYNGSVTIETLQDDAEYFNSGEWIDFIRWGRYYADQNTAADKRVGYPRGDQPTEAFDTQIFSSYDPYSKENIMRGWSGGTWDPSKVTTTDWRGMVYRTGISHNHSLSVSGGTEKVRSYASFGYLNSQSTSYGQKYERFTGNSSVTITPKEWFEMGLSMNAAFSDQDFGVDSSTFGGNVGGNSLYNSATRIYPFAIPFDENGERILRPGGQDVIRTIVDEWKYSTNQREVLNLTGVAYALIKLPIEGLSYRINFGPGFRYRRNGMFLSPLSAVRNSTTNAARVTEQRDINWTLDNQINYIRTFDKHFVGVTLLQTATKEQEVETDLGAENLPLDKALWHAMATAELANVNQRSTSLGNDSRTSYMARVNYTYNDRYLLTASGRWDGASRLAEGHKWSFFPSVALGWRLDQEDFIRNVPWIQQLKLRLGWGVTGNSTVPRYTALGSIKTAFYPYGSVGERIYFGDDRTISGDVVDMVDPLMGWERTSQFNLGIDFSLWNSRVSGVIDIYTSKTTDLLMPATILSLNGYTRTQSNVGATSNRGVDFTLNTINVVAGDFRWESSLNVAYQQNRIDETELGKVDNIANTRFIGEPLRVYYDYQHQGLWKVEDAEEMAKFNANGMGFQVGEVRPVDQNGDYVISPNDDRVIIGQATPAWTGGMTNTFSYKGFDLLISIYGRMGYWDDGGHVAMGGRYMIRKVNYFTDANPNAEYQRPYYVSDGSDADPYHTALRYSKASFLNVRNISLGYNFSRSLLQKWGIDNLRVYAQCINPFAIHQSLDWKNMDLNSSIWNRNYVFGLNIGF
jgi:TonB-linked SusC/RagA family outer membrane protein